VRLPFTLAQRTGNWAIFRWALGPPTRRLPDDVPVL
jgi:hypothetical protein